MENMNGRDPTGSIPKTRLFPDTLNIIAKNDTFNFSNGNFQHYLTPANEQLTHKI